MGSLLASLDAVLRTALRTTVDTQGVERTANDVVPNAGKVPDSSTAHEHDRVLLEVVSFTADVGADLTTIGESHAGDLSQGGVRLLRGLGLHLKADTSS